ncbi:MAG: DUF488 domain-containing protein [Synergistaceae bacterium]|nr:DUF488 domain-containing protein [Synergistota bacterium]NLM70527.1 DUF488 domain-containing protein [Synergistaceae bacterium]
MKLLLKRVYDVPGPEDGFRILVDRLWPRGVTKEAAKVDLWLKDVAPSPDLRKFFNHDPANWDEFRSLYTKELEANSTVEVIREHLRKTDVTLIYAARDRSINHASVIAAFLGREGGGS